jgi:hypothetical protein
MQFAYRAAITFGYWDTGILGYWDTGILGYWDTGIPGSVYIRIKIVNAIIEKTGLDTRPNPVFEFLTNN